MTMEKAIETLSIIKAYEIDNSIRGAEDREAIDMAIKALEQEPCEDCISRQAALDAFGLSEKTRKYGGDHSGYDTLMKYEIQDVLEDLPSVTPQQKMGRWISFGTQGEIDGQIVRAFTCSECGAISVFRMTDGKIVNGDSCANCRAKMEEAEE